MVGTGLIFLIRTLGTVHVSNDVLVARVASMTYGLSYVPLIAFFLVFLRERVDETQRRLRVGTWAALVGCVVAAAIVALNILLLYDRPVVSGHHLGVVSSIASLLIPATGVIFFATFFIDCRECPGRLLLAIKLALVGALLSSAAHGVAFAVIGTLQVPVALHGALLFAGFPIAAFAVGTWIFFFWVVGREP